MNTHSRPGQIMTDILLRLKLLLFLMEQRPVLLWVAECRVPPAFRHFCPKQEVLFIRKMFHSVYSQWTTSNHCFALMFFWRNTFEKWLLYLSRHRNKVSLSFCYWILVYCHFDQRLYSEWLKILWNWLSLFLRARVESTFINIMCGCDYNLYSAFWG